MNARVIHNQSPNAINKDALYINYNNYDCPTVFYVNTTEHLRLHSNGNVGIGNGGPTEKLDVIGNAKVSGNVILTGGQITFPYFQISGTDPNWLGAIAFNRNLGTGAILNSSFRAYQLHNYQGTMFLQSFLANGTPLSSNTIVIDGSNVGIGIDNPTTKLDVDGIIRTTNSSGSGGIMIVNSSTTTAWTITTNNTSEANNFHISHTSDAGGVFLSPGHPTWTTFSDDRVKHNEINITNALDIIMQLKPQTYNQTSEMLDYDFNGNLDDLGINYYKNSGFIAQDIFNINELQHIVHQGDEKTKWGIRYSQIIPYNTAAIKELKTEKDVLESKVNSLENKNNQLETQLIEQKNKISNLESQLENLLNRLLILENN